MAQPRELTGNGPVQGGAYTKSHAALTARTA
jgi:hypothetical protein